jgi:DNA-binding LacI/PurR family transcriptional regulator
MVRHAPFSEAGGAQATKALLDDAPHLTAIFAQSLHQAVGVLFAAAACGRSVPDQLSVICYDDMPLAEFLQPPLTTVRVALEALGSASFDALVRQIDGNEPGDILVPADARVIVRKSTAIRA